MEFQILINLILSYGYLIIFLLMFIEGPITTFIAAFLASMGYFNIYLIFLLAILGNIIPDFLLLFIGRFGRKKFINKILKRFNISNSKLDLIKKNIENHLGKTVIFMKLVPGLAIPGIIFLGFNKITYRKFLIYGVSFDILSELIFLLLGFYSAVSINTLNYYINLEQYSIFIFVFFLFIFYILYKFIKRKILLKLDNLK